MEEICRPEIHMEFDHEQAAYDFYNAYGRVKGFSVRRESCSKDKSGVITSRVFVCSKEGLRRKDKRDDLTKNPRSNTRKGCGALMAIKMDRQIGKYCVYRLSEGHNHDLVKRKYVHMLPSQRKVTASQGAFIVLTANSGVPLKSAFELIGKQAGGRESLGFTKQDQKNYLRTIRQKSMQYGEAGYLMKYFSNQMLENPSFFYEMQLDSEEQITNIFWEDAKMIVDYGMFGDVVSFDTTYKINEENRPCAVFVGLNHHKETVVFGAALMYDETAASYIWLFETFLKAMFRKAPQTILTDQDAAIAKAVLHVMPDTCHQLCIWHLMQNAVKKVGFLFKNSAYDDEGNVFSRFVHQIEEESEFLDAWESMLGEYDAREDKWLAKTFEVRKKWAHAYVKWSWSAGMRSTQLSESFNACLKGYLKSDLQLPEFFTHFERMVYDKRYKELEAEYDLQYRILHCKIEVKILKHARAVCTKTIFKEFQAQYEDSLNYSITKCVSNSDHFIFTVARDGFAKEMTVIREWGFIVSCSCRMFETKGILCRHDIKVMSDGRETTLIKDKILDQYILERWTKNARVDKLVQDMHGREIKENLGLKQVSRNGTLCSKLIRVASRASESEKTHELTVIEADKLAKMVEDVLRLDINGDEDVEQIHNVLNDCSTDGNIVNAKRFRKRETTHRGKCRSKGDFEANLSKKKGLHMFGS